MIVGYQVLLQSMLLIMENLLSKEDQIKKYSLSKKSVDWRSFILKAISIKFIYRGVNVKPKAASSCVIRDLKQTLEAARWTSTGRKISRSQAN